MVWEYPSNFSGGQNVNSLSSFFGYVNYISADKFGFIILGIVFIIAFLTLKNSGFSAGKALTSAMFGATMISILLMMMGILPFYIPMILVIVTAVMAIVMRNESNVGL